jgi:hypothetical protein
MSKSSKNKRASLKTAEVKDDTKEIDVMAIVEEQQRRSDLQRRGLSSQGQPDNGAPVVSNGEREALATQNSQRGYYNLPEDMLPNSSKDED